MLRWLEFGAAAAVVVALAWWAVVYAQVVLNTGFPPARTLPCLLHTSDRCSLAMSLCKDWHFLGIRRYSPELLWAGTAAVVLALTLGGRSANAPRADRGDPM